MSENFGEAIRHLPLFAGLSDQDLDRLYEMAETVNIDAGQVLMEEGSPGDALYVALAGKFEISKRSGERDLVIAGCGPGDLIGEISLLEGAPRTATVRALENGRLLKISRAAFEHLVTWSPSAALAVVSTVTSRLRNTEMMLRQSEKMAALGTLSAGLAHELNNPAAAVRRSAAQLRETIAHWQQTAAHLASVNLNPSQVDVSNVLRAEMPRRTAGSAQLDPLTRGDLEAELQIWLEEHGIPEAWELAPALLALGWGVRDVESMTAALNPAQLAAFVQWWGTGCTVYALLDEVHQGAERISEIVKAVKSYSYLDQAPVQLVDVREGLENTLIILRHKLKQGVTVRREFAQNLPRIEAYASELNQVWTNIIDNAVDAMGGHGEITLRTFPQNGHIVVEITDNGPGIPPEIQPRIFDAFYTTKPLGVGTGLGLNIAWNIIVHQHKGNIAVKSRPGETTFQVTLPIQQKPNGRSQEVGSPLLASGLGG